MIYTFALYNMCRLMVYQYQLTTTIFIQQQQRQLKKMHQQCLLQAIIIALQIITCTLRATRCFFFDSHLNIWHRKLNFIRIFI